MGQTEALDVSLLEDLRDPAAVDACAERLERLARLPFGDGEVASVPVAAVQQIRPRQALKGIETVVGSPERAADDLRARPVVDPGLGSIARNLGNGERELREEEAALGQDRKSTRLNSSHLGISYAVFCLKKKKT